MGIPQIVYLVLMCMGFGLAIAKHGEPQEGMHNIWVDLISQAITLALLAWGGFFSGQ